MQQIPKYQEGETVKLDLKDKKILFELDFDGRSSYSALAKAVGLSKQGAEYKVNNLIKKGVIKGFYPVINVAKLGYFYCRLMLTLKNLTKEKHKEIVDYLNDHKKVFWLFSMQGPFDLVIVIWAKTFTEFVEFVRELESKFGEHIKGKKETIATDVIHYQHRYLLGEEKTEEIHIRETTERVEIDHLDKRILNILCDDGRIPIVEIAEKVGESAKVVAYRIKKMEEKGLIEAYRPIINHSKIGYTYYKIALNLSNVTKEEIERLKAYVRNNPLVIYIVEGIGLPGDFEWEMMVRSNQQLFDFIEDLKFRFPKLVEEYQTIIFIDTLKVKYLPF